MSNVIKLIVLYEYLVEIEIPSHFKNGKKHCQGIKCNKRMRVLMIMMMMMMMLTMMMMMILVQAPFLLILSSLHSTDQKLSIPLSSFKFWTRLTRDIRLFRFAGFSMS